MAFKLRANASGCSSVVVAIRSSVVFIFSKIRHWAVPIVFCAAQTLSAAGKMQAAYFFPSASCAK
jgi:hypothetical protein